MKQFDSAVLGLGIQLNMCMIVWMFLLVLVFSSCPHGYYSNMLVWMLNSQINRQKCDS